MVQRIKELCKAKGITVAELERRCGIGNGIIARWKTSKPSYERLAKVAKELETSVEYLQTGEGQKEKPTPEAGGGPKYAPGYELLTPENRAKADSYLAFLLAEQQNGQT